MSSQSVLLGTKLFGKTFIQDPNLKTWIKIDDVVMGDSVEYGYGNGTNGDIKNLLNTVFMDTKVSVCLYEWKSGKYYTKTGYKVNDGGDTKQKGGYTAFVAIRNSASLVGTSLLGSNFVKDPNFNNLIKIDGVVLGNNARYGYSGGTNGDIKAVLTKVFGDPKVRVCLYEWATGNYYTKTGYDLSDQSDYSKARGFTAYIVGGDIATDPTNKQIVDRSTINQPQLQNGGFITRDGINLIGPDGKFSILGCNSNWMGQPNTNPNQQEEIFSIMQRMKGTTIRSHTLGFSTGVAYSLIQNPENWAPIDHCFMLAKKYNIKLLCPLIDSYSGYGAGDYGDYCIAAGVDKSQFFTDGGARDKFKEYIRYWLEHVNPLTNMAIKDSPELLMIELGNEIGEPRPGSTNSIAIPTQEWFEDITNYIRTIDKNHIIMCPTDETLGQSGEFNVANLGCYSGHYYWFDTQRLDYSIQNSHNAGKPYIIGEYDSKFGQDWYDMIYNKGVDGCLLWSLYPYSDGLNGGEKRIWNDGYSMYYPDNKDQLLIISNYFRKMQGLPWIDSI
jgi:hypothetical protein